MTTSLQDYKEEQQQSYEERFTEQVESVDTFIQVKKAEIDEIEGNLKSLMPEALTKGLSFAYLDKKTIEVNNYSKLEKSFKSSIYFIVGTSLIPVAINILLLIKGAAVQQVLADTPKLVLGMLPVYFPLVWLAFSNNKKMNLSKRLIEEYTHKEVLSKTYEGLSNQVDKISDSETSQKLRNKLLGNLIEINSENPGKLISNYDKSDHPFMEALERSAQLTDSVERLAKIPGFRAMASKLSERSEKVLQEQEIKVSKGLDINSENEEHKASGPIQ